MNLVYGELPKWKSFRKYAFSISLFLALGSSVNAATVASPDGRLILTIETTTEGTNPPTPHLVYQLSFRGELLANHQRCGWIWKASLRLATTCRWSIPPRRAKTILTSS